jgi:hypothetical protein
MNDYVNHGVFIRQNVEYSLKLVTGGYKKQINCIWSVIAILLAG